MTHRVSIGRNVHERAVLGGTTPTPPAGLTGTDPPSRHDSSLQPRLVDPRPTLARSCGGPGEVLTRIGPPASEQRLVRGDSLLSAQVDEVRSAPPSTIGAITAGVHYVRRRVPSLISTIDDDRSDVENHWRRRSTNGPPVTCVARGRFRHGTALAAWVDDPCGRPVERSVDRNPPVTVATRFRSLVRCPTPFSIVKKHGYFQMRNIMSSKARIHGVFDAVRIDRCVPWRRVTPEGVIDTCSPSTRKRPNSRVFVLLLVICVGRDPAAPASYTRDPVRALHNYRCNVLRPNAPEIMHKNTAEPAYYRCSDVTIRRASC
jgi:hypothetical protein